METSIFMDKKVTPTVNELIRSLQDTSVLWQNIIDYVHLKYPKGMDDWNYPGDKYGWSFRIKDTKRAIIYLLPRDGYFKAAFVFGQKATDAILLSPVSETIKTELMSARVYAEGRGIRIEVRNEECMKDIRELIDIKIKY